MYLFDVLFNEMKTFQSNKNERAFQSFFICTRMDHFPLFFKRWMSKTCVYMKSKRRGELSLSRQMLIFARWRLKF